MDLFNLKKPTDVMKVNSSTSTIVPPKPPVTYEEFCELEGLEEWPVRLTSESHLDLSEERDKIALPDDFMKQLKDATPVDLERFVELDKRLEIFDRDLYGLAAKMLARVGNMSPDDSVPRIEYPLSVKKVIQDEERPMSDAVVTHPSQKKKAITFRECVNVAIEKKQAQDFKEKVMESQKRSVEHCEFPGFRVGELTELPASIEAPQILHRVTKAQEFNPGFRKFWKKIFQSEASVAMMQDSFWWIFLEVFQRDKKKLYTDQSYIFDRMADNFVALFSSIDNEFKDKMFGVYPDCLAQAIFAAYWEAFPESRRLFNDMFKQYICNVCKEWVAGMKAPPGAYEAWDIRKLEPKFQKATNETASKTDYEMPSLTSSEKQDDGDQYENTMNEFLLMLDTLGGKVPDVMFTPSRELTRITNMDKGKASKAPQESSYMGRGPEMERSIFDLGGKSPLVMHYLRMRSLHPVQSDVRVKAFRTEIVGSVSRDQQTYRDLIRETKASSDMLSKEYQKVCDMTNQEINRIEKNTRDTNRKIEKLQKQLMFCKNSLEVKLMSEQVLGKSTDTDGANLALQDDSNEEESDG